jgi:hypothetical protein
VTDSATQLAAALPKDPDDHGPIGVPSDAVRGVLAELVQLRKRSSYPTIAEFVGHDPTEDGGA